METPVQPGFRVTRGPDWSYKNQDGGKGHAGTVIRLQDIHQPYFPLHSVLVQWDNGDKGLYRVGYDQAYDLRILETANSVCHTKVWCDGCDADEIRGIRWRCTECYAIDLCTTCYMNDEHDLSHVFMRVLSSHKTSMGPRMLPRSSSPRIALQGSFPGAKVVRHPQWYKRVDSDTLLGKVVRHRQTPEERVEVQTVVEFSSTSERIHFTKISCTLPGSGGNIYDGHLPLLGDLEPVNEGDKVFVISNPEELEKLHKCRGLWKPEMAKTFRKKGSVTGRTNTGDFEVTCSDSQETFIMNPLALRKIQRFCLSQLVRISDDIEMVKRLQFGHGGWTAAMKQAIGKVGEVAEIDGSDIHVRLKDGRKFIFNTANLTLEKPVISKPRQCLVNSLSDFSCDKKDPEMNITLAAISGDIKKVECILAIHPEWINYEPKPGRKLLAHVACKGPTHMVKFLVEKGACIDSVDEMGCTPLYYATVRKLEPSSQVAFRLKLRQNETARNKDETVRYLLEQGADVDAANYQGFTSLSKACSHGFYECAHHLLMHGADINHRSDEDMTPVLVSIDGGYRTTMDLIMDRKDADLKTVTRRWVSALHGAAAKNNAYAMRKLLDKVPRLVEARDDAGETPLFHAMYRGSLNAAEILIKEGQCDVNAQDSEVGFCPLAVAISNEQFKLVDFLVKNGADPNLPTRYGNTSLQIALNVILAGPHGKYMKEEPYMAEMKKKWRRVGIRTNGDALLAYLVSHGADLDAYNDIKITIRHLMSRTQRSLLHALDEIQAQTGRDIARLRSTANCPLRHVTKKTDGTETEANSVSAVLKKKKRRRRPKKKSTGNPSGLVSPSPGSQEKSSDKESRDDEQKASAGSEEKTSGTGEVSQLQAELKRKDEELKSLRSKVKTLEHMVEKKISLSGDHDAI